MKRVRIVFAIVSLSVLYMTLASPAAAEHCSLAKAAGAW